MALVVLALAAMAEPAGAGHPPVIDTFPAPGDQVASPQTQIVFRGEPISRLGRVVVTGSRSGRHAGRLVADSDGHGGSFLPNRPFAPGEVVTVRTGLRILDGRRGTFQFTVATPAGAIPLMPLQPAARTAGDVLQFQSRPDLTPPAVEVSKDSDPGGGDIFLGPQDGPLQNGPMIVDPSGNLVWFKPLPSGEQADDVMMQTYHGHPVLTWWQGRQGAGVGFGEDVIDNTSYRQIRTVRAGNGLSADLHEFLLTPQGTALITAYEPVYWNWAGHREVVLDAVVQEIDIPTGLVLFQWNSLDHVPLSASDEPPPSPGQPFDYFHVNSIQLDAYGDLIISARNTWAAYAVDYRSGRVLWTLGGKQSSFTMGPGASFAFQHDVRLHPGDAETVTVFDDGSGPPTVHSQSRAITLRLDLRNRTAELVSQEEHAPALSSAFEGDLEHLPSDDTFVGWGQQPYFTEFAPGGQVLLDGRFVDANSSYRVFRYPWRGTPDTPPAIAATTAGSQTTVFASWNGATEVSSWRVLGGSSAGGLRVIGTAAKHGFETRLTLGAERYVAVQALSADGRVLGTSKTIAAGGA